MADVHDKKTRSYNMSRIKGKNTKPEMLVRKFLHANGFRYRLHVKDLPGKPDIVLPKYKTVIFVHGCFWHKHFNCKHNKLPKKNHDYWIPKLDGNKDRDKKHIKELKSIDWKVITVWECGLSKANIDDTLNNLLLRLNMNCK
jgi:DNA mismatch endonuclease (patch repair protein)